MWQITYDHLENKAVDVKSRNFKPGTNLTEKFKMYDDDGNLCYSGFSDDSESEDGFAPLDDYGTPNVGCTYIEYWRNGKWEIL